MKPEAQLDDTTVGGRVWLTMSEYGLTHNKFARLAGRKTGYLSNLFKRTAANPKYRPKEPTIRELVEAIERVAVQVNKDPVHHEWLSSGAGPRFKTRRKTFGEIESYLEAEAKVLQTEEGQHIPRVGFRIARKRVAELEKVYTEEDVLSVVRYVLSQTPPNEVKDEDTQMRIEEDREANKVRQLHPTTTPPPPTRKGPAVRSAQTRKR